MRKSAPLRRKPKTILFYDTHNFAGVTDKIMKSLETDYKVYSIGKTKMSKQLAAKLFRQKDTLLLYVEPGTLQYRPKRNYDHWLPRSYRGVKIPKKMPFGFWWSGSVYRVDNHANLYNLPEKERNWFKKRRNYYNKLSKFKLVGTDDLLLVDRSAYFVGQPISMPKNFPDKEGAIDRVIHTASSPEVTDHYKGTDVVRRAFSKTSENIPSEILQGEEHDVVVDKLRHSTMAVQSMTNWRYGLCYTGMEAIANGCMLMSKNSNATRTNVVDVRDVNDLVKKINHYRKNPNMRIKIAKRQFKWLKNNFSMGAFRRRFNEALADCIKGGWS